MSLSPTPTIEDIQERLATLENLVYSQTIQADLLLVGINNLKQGGDYWKNKIYTLLHQANVPRYWIIDMTQNPLDSNQATIHGINGLVIQVIATRIKQHLNLEL